MAHVLGSGRGVPRQRLVKTPVKLGPAQTGHTEEGPRSRDQGPSHVLPLNQASLIAVFYASPLAA